MTTGNCEELTSGNAGAVYTMEITIETIQVDRKCSYSPWRLKLLYYVKNEINGRSWPYNAKKEMTWKEWFSGKYNTESFGLTSA